MDFMIGVIIGIVVASFLSWYVIHKEIESLRERNDILQKSMLLNYESNLLRREEILHARVYRSFLKKENPQILVKMKNKL